MRQNTNMGGIMLQELFNAGSRMDFIDDVPVPTKEEDGIPEPPPPEDLGHKDIKTDHADITIDIGRNEDGAKIIPPQVDENAPQQLHAQITELLAYVDYCELCLSNYRHGRIGQEGFTDGVKRAITGIANIFGHLVELFASRVLYAFRDFKRSELMAYIDSNKFTWLRLKSCEFSEYSEVSVPVPTGMEGTYNQALTLLEEFLNFLDFRTVTKQMRTASERLLKDMRRSPDTLAASITTLEKTYLPQNIKSKFDAMGKVFTNVKKFDEKLMREVFADSAEFIDVVNRCQDDSVFFREVAGIHSNLTDISKNIEVFNSMVNDNVDPKMIDQLVVIIRTWAEAFDMYATTINDLQRVDHNLMWVVKGVRKALKM